MNSSQTNSKILILEDDSDQMDLLVSFAQSEIKKLSDDENINDEQRHKIENIKIIKVSNISSLQQAVSMHKDVLLAVLDCNTPDTKGGVSHDQLVKTNHRITGQHRAVDIVTDYLPDTPITIISSLDRFRIIVHKYYESKHSLNINFVSKAEPLGVRRNIRSYLREYLSAAD